MRVRLNNHGVAAAKDGNLKVFTELAIRILNVITCSFYNQFTTRNSLEAPIRNSQLVTHAFPLLHSEYLPSKITM